MGKLYWKIFFTFWLTTILIIATTAWVTSEFFKSHHQLVYHDIISTIDQLYPARYADEYPLAPSYFLHISWTGLSLRLVIAMFVSGFICYLLSLYLTRPLRALCIAAKSLASGNLHTRVGPFSGHHKDEIAQLSHEFDSMAAQVEALINEKQRLLQDISHELRSPLARLTVAIEIGRTKTHDLAKNEFDRIETECIRLNALVSEILDFAHLNRSTNTLSKSRVNLPALIHTITNDANYECSNTTPRVVMGAMDPCELMLDERLIHRAIENVVRNALWYSPPNQPVLVSLHQNSEKNQILVDIEDNGPGVPEDELTSIFNPFYRVDSARRKKTGGYGLGLAIAARAIQLHQGEIVAINRQQGGLLVRIVLGSTFRDPIALNGS